MNTSIKDPFESFADSGDYGKLVKDKLEHVLMEKTPQQLAPVIRKVIENLVITERLAEAAGLSIEDSAKNEILQKEYADIQSEVDRAVGVFVGSLLSCEGG
ncbi:hypothetical protein CEE37_11495 [candidate division LCP-89 bacterium B3_LCP]|uniref:Uncharacterized protein n=1 Tax=candidate division LCP-89 bacterium B3_LCP TaxID=2012998 RepID=A0A532UVU4_UNCL8|nr:MAG: hypothetical protein CEE37_11495 [candidate division LCP-89 bacterium B3_LCP]